MKHFFLYCIIASIFVLLANSCRDGNDFDDSYKPSLSGYIEKSKVTVTIDQAGFMNAATEAANQAVLESLTEIQQRAVSGDVISQTSDNEITFTDVNGRKTVTVVETFFTFNINDVTQTDSTIEEVLTVLNDTKPGSTIIIYVNLVRVTSCQNYIDGTKTGGPEYRTDVRRVKCQLEIKPGTFPLAMPLSIENETLTRDVSVFITIAK